MPEQTEDSYLILLPFPLTAATKKKLAADLKKKLEKESLKKIITAELKTIYDWKKISHLPTRRLYRNYTLIYSPKELGKQIHLAVLNILG